jgi:di/tricarboxylate transporter
MFAINKPRMDAVALIMLVALPFTGVITMPEALAGFSDPNIVLIAALFVIGDGLVRTGVARKLGDWLAATAGKSENRLVALLMSVVAGLGATMSSTAVTAIFIPVTLRISQGTGTSPGRLMMPLSFAALISGMLTLVATAPNLVVNSELMRRGGDSFSFFAFTPFGLPVLVLAILYMLVARKWLPDNKVPTADAKLGRPTMATWIERYGLVDREHRFRVTPQSGLVGKTLAEIRLHQISGAHLLAIERERTLLQPSAQTKILAGDGLMVDFYGPEQSADAMIEQFALERLSLSGNYFSDQSQDIGMVEVILPADSPLVGQTISQAQFRDRTGLTMIGIRRGTDPVKNAIADEVLHLGDTLLLVGPWNAIESTQSTSHDFVALNLPAEHSEVLAVRGRAIHAVICMAIVIGLMVSGLVPNVHAALLGCLMMGALGCVTLESGYRSIDWKTIVLIVGMLPFSLALERTGGVDLASEALTTLTAEMGPRGVLAVLFLLTALLGMFISNTATAVLMAPVAMSIAEDLDLSLYPFAMIIALAASTAFMTPVSSPVNTLVVTPGNYTFSDFVKLVPREPIELA